MDRWLKNDSIFTQTEYYVLAGITDAMGNGSQIYAERVTLVGKADKRNSQLLYCFSWFYHLTIVSCPPFRYKGFSGGASEHCRPLSFLFTDSWANKHSAYCRASQFCTGSDRTHTPSIFMNLTFCLIFSCTITVTC